MASGKRYDREFKEGAVKLVTKEGRSAALVASELGVGESTLHKWIKASAAHGKDAFPGSGHMRPDDAELKRLREEVRILRIERDILKKTLPLFMEARK